MNKKNAIVSIVLIALMCGFIVPTGVKGFLTGPPPYTPNTSYNAYGPNIQTLWIHGYSGNTAQINAISAKTIDFIDNTLTPTQYSTLQGIGGFNFTFVTQLALDQIDWNKAFFPMNNSLYSIAISEILQGGSGSTSEKAKFVNTWLGTGAAPCYAPNPGQIIENSGQPWYDETTGDIFTGGYSAALADLLTCGFPLTRDMITGSGNTYATWNFSAPFPVSGGLSYNPLHPDGTGATGYNLMGDGADNNHGEGGISILTRTSDQRVNLGPELERLCEANFTWWYNNQASVADKASWTAALTAAGLPTTLLPRIEVNVKLVTMAQIYDPVFSYYCYEMYTGGFSYGSLPSSMLENYMTSNSPQAFGWGSYHDYNCYTNPAYDSFMQFMENSTTPAAGVTYCHLAQLELMGGATYGPALYPAWVYTGYSPTIASDYQTHKYASYAGYGTWWTYVNGYPTSGSPGYSSNAFFQGMRSPFPELPNPVSSSSYYCYIMLNEIYDTLTVADPYNASKLIPYIATSWTTGTWNNPDTGKTCTTVTATMRGDVYWQDVPGPQDRSAFTWNGGNQLDGPLTNRLMTPLDVAFSYAYGALGWGFTIAYDYSGTDKFDHVAINPMYQAAWEDQIGHNATVDGTPWCNETYVNDLYGVSGSTPLFPVYQAVTPGQTPYYTAQQYLENFVQFNSSLGTDQIEVFQSILQPWLFTYYALGTVLLPMDIFSNLALGSWPNNGIHAGFVTPDETAMDLQPYSYNSGQGADLLYGSGPFIMVDDAAAETSTNMRLERYIEGLTYGPGLTGDHGTDTVTTANSYFWNTAAAIVVSAVPGSGTATSTVPTADPGPTITFATTLQNKNSSDADITYSWTYKYYSPDGTLLGSGTAAGGAVTITASGGTQTLSATVGPLNNFANPLTFKWTLLYTYLGKYYSTPTSSAEFTYPGLAGDCGITGFKLYTTQTLNNSGSAVNIDYWFTWTADSGDSGATTPVTGYSMASGVSVISPTYIYLGQLASKPTWDTDVVVSWTFHWDISSSPSTVYNMSFSKTLNVHSGDIAGGTVNFEYIGANHICNLQDLGLITGNWQVPATIGGDPTTPTVRADINNNGFINIADLGYVTGNWQSTW